jgi:hypothetical protein
MLGLKTAYEVAVARHIPQNGLCDHQSLVDEGVPVHSHRPAVFLNVCTELPRDRSVDWCDCCLRVIATDPAGRPRWLPGP